MGCHRGGVSLVEQRPRHHVSQAQRHSRQLGYRGERAIDGLWQHGRRLRHRGRFHAQSGDGRACVLRRVSSECTGRGCRGRHQDSAADLEGAGRRRREVSSGNDARGVRAARGCLSQTRGSLPRHAGHRIHHSVGKAVSPADSDRKAHRFRRSEDRVRHGGREAHRIAGGGGTGRSGTDRPVAGPGVRPDRKAEGDAGRTRCWQRPSGRTRCCSRPDRLQRGARSGHGQRRPGDHGAD